MSLAQNSVGHDLEYFLRGTLKICISITQVRCSLIIVLVGSMTVLLLSSVSRCSRIRDIGRLLCPRRLSDKHISRVKNAHSQHIICMPCNKSISELLKVTTSTASFVRGPHSISELRLLLSFPLRQNAPSISRSHSSFGQTPACAPPLLNLENPPMYAPEVRERFLWIVCRFMTWCPDGKLECL